MPTHESSLCISLEGMVAHNNATLKVYFEFDGDDILLGEPPQGLIEFDRGGKAVYKLDDWQAEEIRRQIREDYAEQRVDTERI